MSAGQGELPFEAPRPRDAVCVPRHVVIDAANRLARLHNLPTIAKTLLDRCQGVPDGECCWIQEAIAKRYGLTVDG